MSFEASRTLREEEPSRAPGVRSLVVIGPDGVRSMPLPEEGSLHIGRGPDNELRIEDHLLSRNHAVLHVDKEIEIEDLESANGTRLAGVRIPPKTRQRFGFGAVVDLGATLLVLRRGGDRESSTQLLAHGPFEARLHEECRRARDGLKAPIVVLRVKVSGPIAADALEAALTADLRPGEIVAGFAPRELEVLLLDGGKLRAERFSEALRARLEGPGRVVQIAFAVYPQDGRSADALLEAASARLHGARQSDPNVVVVAAKMKELYRIVDRVAAGQISVLLLGETGVGKELVAEAVHRASPRKKAPFVRINCAALSETLIESELFGFEKGAFTGADQAKAGLLETATGGTLFLDEIGELPLGAQAKLLRVLEQREVLRVGAVQPRPVDVRIVAATNRDLEREVERERFRRDLYFRLNGIALEVPPLRERTEEIVFLAELFSARVAKEMGFLTPTLSPTAAAMLRGYSWPGNVRELRNVMERAVLLCADGIIEPIHLPFEKLTTTWQVTATLEGAPAESALKDRIVAALEEHAGNQTRAAQQLGFSRQTLSKWMDRFGIKRPRRP